MYLLYFFIVIISIVLLFFCKQKPVFVPMPQITAKSKKLNLKTITFGPSFHLPFKIYPGQKIIGNINCTPLGTQFADGTVTWCFECNNEVIFEEEFKPKYNEEIIISHEATHSNCKSGDICNFYIKLHPTNGDYKSWKFNISGSVSFI